MNLQFFLTVLHSPYNKTNHLRHIQRHSDVLSSLINLQSCSSFDKLGEYLFSGVMAIDKTQSRACLALGASLSRSSEESQQKYVSQFASWLAVEGNPYLVFGNISILLFYHFANSISSMPRGCPKLTQT